MKKLLKVVLFTLWLLTMVLLLARKPIIRYANEVIRMGGGGCFPTYEIEMMDPPKPEG